MLINKINLSFLKNNFNIFILVIDNFVGVFVLKTINKINNTLQFARITCIGGSRMVTDQE